MLQRPPTTTTTDESGGRRDEVIRMAASLFDRGGYHATSMEDIATAVGLRKPTLYHYFGSKDEILFWVHEEFIDLLIERQDARSGTAMTPAQLMLETMGDVLELMETHRGHVRVFFEHHRELAAPEHAAIAAKRARYEAGVAAVIQRGVDEERFRPIDVKLATLAVFGICNWAYQWYRPDGLLRSRDIAYVFWDLLLNGIDNRPADRDVAS